MSSPVLCLSCWHGCSVYELLNTSYREKQFCVLVSLFFLNLFSTTARKKQSWTWDIKLLDSQETDWNCLNFSVWCLRQNLRKLLLTLAFHDFFFFFFIKYVGIKLKWFWCWRKKCLYLIWKVVCWIFFFFFFFP